jgi:hypothetical protein
MSTCPECGLSHPPVVPGSCPVAKEQNRKDELKAKMGSKLFDSFESIQKSFVEKFKDADETTINKAVAQIRNLIMNFKV